MIPGTASQQSGSGCRAEFVDDPRAVSGAPCPLTMSNLLNFCPRWQQPLQYLQLRGDGVEQCARGARQSVGRGVGEHQRHPNRAANPAPAGLGELGSDGFSSG